MIRTRWDKATGQGPARVVTPSKRVNNLRPSGNRAPRGEPEQVRLDNKITGTAVQLRQDAQSYEVVTQAQQAQLLRMEGQGIQRPPDHHLRSQARAAKDPPWIGAMGRDLRRLDRQAIASTCDGLRKNVDSTLMLIESEPKSAAELRRCPCGRFCK